MAEVVVSLAVDQLLPLLREEANLLKGIPKEFANIKNELESMQAFLRDADRRAAAGKGDNSGSEGIKTWVKQVIEAAFRIEDIIDEYMVCVAQQPRHPGCAASLRRIAHLIKTLIPRHRIVCEIQGIKSSVREIKERSERYRFQIQPFVEQNAKWHDPRMASLYMEEAEVVGFEGPRNRLIDWLVKGGAERTAISLVAMGGQGKTTLARKVFDSKEVVGHFDCRVWITVSQSYSIEGLLRDMLLKFYKQQEKDPQDIVKMDRVSLIDEARNYLQQKRYVVVFDDVWNIHFWNEIKSAVIDNKKGSKIFITTRNMDVAVSCKKSSLVQVHELQPLNKVQSLELFNKKAFRYDYGGCCPKELIDISSDIVNKCEGLPLAIVAIGGLLSTKEKDAFEWQRFSENLRLEIKEDSHLVGINEILGLSYDDLPYYLKPCLLYFGIYPEDYEVKSKRIIRQWIAEGFVKEERGKTLEQVAEGYLTELIGRSLVQVSSIKIDGKAKSCRVHDLIRVMILEKFEDLSFCKHTSGQSSLSGRIRRLSVLIASNDLMPCIETTHVRSLLVFPVDKSALLHRDKVSRFPAKYRLLKVLDFEDAPLFYVSKNLRNLIHLKYLSTKWLKKGHISKFIGMLQSLETLDVRDTYIREIPKEISKLRKLRHLVGAHMNLTQLKDGIGGMTSLQTLCYVSLSGDADEQVKVIRELGKLKKLRELGLLDVRREHGSALSSSINEMQHLEKLRIKETVESEEVIDLNLISSSSMLRNITLGVKLDRLPEWIPQLQNLVKLKLLDSRLTVDPVKSLKDMPNLLSLSIVKYAYKGESLHFRDGGFQKLKELYLGNLLNLNSIVIDKGALHSLKKLQLWSNTQLKTVPTGIQYLEKLQVLIHWDMPIEFSRSIARDEGLRDHTPSNFEKN